MHRDVFTIPRISEEVLVNQVDAFKLSLSFLRAIKPRTSRGNPSVSFLSASSSTSRPVDGDGDDDDENDDADDGMNIGVGGKGVGHWSAQSHGTGTPLLQASRLPSLVSTGAPFMSRRSMPKAVLLSSCFVLLSGDIIGNNGKTETNGKKKVKVPPRISEQ